MKLTNNKNYEVKNLFFKVFTNDINFQREKYFYNFFQKKNIPVLELIYKKKLVLIFKKIKIQKIKNKELYINKFLKFLIMINSKKFKNKYKIAAKENFTSIKNLNNEIKKRLSTLKKIKNKNLQIFLKTIEKKFNQIRLNHISNPKKKNIISPSDVGIHNAGIHKNKVIFFDFEYAGLDHPLKLICDLYYQPEYRISRKEMISFIYKFSDVLNYNLLYELKKIENYYKLKMCLIILNIFIDKKFNYKKKTIDDTRTLEKIKKMRLKKSQKIFIMQNIT
jgi:hypothetical protein